MGETRRPEPLVPRPQGSAASGGWATHIEHRSPLRFRPWALARELLALAPGQA